MSNSLNMNILGVKISDYFLKIHVYGTLKWPILMRNGSKTFTVI